MAVVSMKQLLESGVHFGHQTRRWNPKMAKYIYTKRNGIHIIDLQQTVQYIDDAYKRLNDIASDGGKLLIVGTKKQAHDAVVDAAKRSDQFYVSKRWLGGTLTNFKTIRKSIRRLHQITQWEKDGTFERLPKKERVELRKELARLEMFLGGIKEMRTLPDAIFIVDPRKEHNAIREARKLNIPIFGMVDTNCDPDEIDYIIPANDDAIRSIKVIVNKMADAMIEGSGGQAQQQDAPKQAQPQKQAQKQAQPQRKERPSATKADLKKKMDSSAAKSEAKPAPKAEAKPAPKAEAKPAPKAEAKPAPKAEKKTQPKTETKKVEASQPKKETVDLESKTVSELRQLAKDKGLSGYSKLRKAELIEALK